MSLIVISRRVVVAGVPLIPEMPTSSCQNNSLRSSWALGFSPLFLTSYCIAEKHLLTTKYIKYYNICDKAPVAPGSHHQIMKYGYVPSIEPRHQSINQTLCPLQARTIRLFVVAESSRLTGKAPLCQWCKTSGCHSTPQTLKNPTPLFSGRDTPNA